MGGRMKRSGFLGIPLVLIAAVLTFTIPALAATTYTKATKVGRAHGPSCGKGGFPDITGKCWTCPKGYKHKNILLPPTHNKVCEKAGTTTKRKGIKVGKSILGVCKKGWVSLNNGNCYRCPKGYKHNPAKFGTATGVCYRKSPKKYSKANRVGGSLVCKRGFFDLAEGGTCWTCPANAPVRTLKSVKSAKACQSAACGRGGERLCKITENILPCRKGFLPNYLKNVCAPFDAGTAICKATVAAVKAGKTVAGFTKIFSSSKSRTKSGRDKYRNGGNRNALMQQITNDINRHKHVIPELKRIMTRMQARKKQVEALFDTNNFCSLSSAEIDRRLTRLGLKPSFPRRKASWLDDGILIRRAHAENHDRFYMGYQVGVSGAVGLGVQVSMLFVTDFRGNGGRYLAVGPQLVTNASVDVSPIGLQFFPKVSLDDFKGWGWGVGVSGGPPSKIVSAGVDVAFDEKFKDFQGFGLSGAIGLGVIPGDISVSAEHAWKMK